MPRLDAHHHIVKRALRKDGWEISSDQFLVKYNGLHVYIDLVAERQSLNKFMEAETAIEIKVFGGASFVDDFEKAIGQYSLYRFLLKGAKIQRELYLALTEEAFDEFFTIPAVEEYLAEHQIHLLIFDPEKEEIIQWIKQQN